VQRYTFLSIYASFPSQISNEVQNCHHKFAHTVQKHYLCNVKSLHMNNYTNLIRRSIPLLFGLGCYLFWWKGYPEALSWHEQNQMFQLSFAYLEERIAVPGGLTDWLGEGLSQFYYYPACGAFILAFITWGVQALSYQVIRRSALQKEGKKNKINWSQWALSFLPALLLWKAMGDINTLLSYSVSLVWVLGTYLQFRKVPLWIQLLVGLALYWVAGPLYLITIGLIITDEFGRQKKTRAIIEGILLLALSGSWVYLCRMLWAAQYPWNTIIAGINYHRLSLMTCEAPILLYLIAMWIILLPVLGKLIGTFTKQSIADYLLAILLLISSYGWFGATIDDSFNPNTYVLLEQQYLVRRGAWQQIIEKGGQYKSKELPIIKSPEYITGLNLALAKSGNMNRLFEFHQQGLQGLIMPWKRDNMTCVSSMEAFWQLGFINESMRYAFDLQESILNCRKSARYTLRLAECNIINGRYEVASKYIDQLKKTLFYRRWAELAEGYLYNEERINTYPEWQQKQQFRLESDFLYYYPQMHKMLGHLVLQNRQNTLAYDYMMASLLLIGNTHDYVAYLPQQPKAGQNPFPKGYDQYIEYMKRQPNTDATTSASEIIK